MNLRKRSLENLCTSKLSIQVILTRHLAPKLKFESLSLISYTYLLLSFVPFLNNNLLNKNFYSTMHVALGRPFGESTSCIARHELRRCELSMSRDRTDEPMQTVCAENKESPLKQQQLQGVPDTELPKSGEEPLGFRIRLLSR